jgi:hypothetical protein
VQLRRVRRLQLLLNNGYGKSERNLNGMKMFDALVKHFDGNLLGEFVLDGMLYSRSLLLFAKSTSEVVTLLLLGVEYCKVRRCRLRPPFFKLELRISLHCQTVLKISHGLFSAVRQSVQI